MPRLDSVAEDQMDDEQRALYDTIIASGRGVRGPLGVLMHAPEVGARVTEFVNHFLSDTRMPRNLKELAILAVARQYTSQYEWFVHEPSARAAGVEDSVIEAIRARRRPDFTNPDEALVFDMVNEIVETRQLSDALYDEAVASFGAEAVVELITQIGFYHAISVVLNVYQIEAGDGGVPLPD